MISRRWFDQLPARNLFSPPIADCLPPARCLTPLAKGAVLGERRSRGSFGFVAEVSFDRVRLLDQVDAEAGFGALDHRLFAQPVDLGQQLYDGIGSTPQGGRHRQKVTGR